MSAEGVLGAIVERLDALTEAVGDLTDATWELRDELRDTSGVRLELERAADKRGQDTQALAREVLELMRNRLAAPDPPGFGPLDDEDPLSSGGAPELEPGVGPAPAD